MIVVKSIDPDAYAEVHRLAGRIRGIVQHPAHLYKIMSDHFGDTFFVARETEDGKEPILGFMMGFVSQSIRGHLFVWQIAVTEKAHGKGIGSKLLDHTIDYARKALDCTAVMATVETVNAGSQRLFEKNGFQIASERFKQPGQDLTVRNQKEAVVNYYGSGTDQVFYLLEL